MSKHNDEKVKIKIIKLGYFPFEFNHKKIEKWESDLFSISGKITEIKTMKKLHDNDIHDDKYLNEKINSINKNNGDYDFVFVISNIMLEDEWFSRILDTNKVIMSFKTISETLKFNNIPLENAVITLLYSYSFLFKQYGKIPDQKEEKVFLHTDTRGCIFDLAPKEGEIIYSCLSPIICEECTNDLADNIDQNLIKKCRKELRRIQKTTANRIATIVKRQPIVSALFTISLPISLSLLTSTFLNGLNMYIKLMFMIMPILLLAFLWIKSLIKSE